MSQHSSFTMDDGVAFLEGQREYIEPTIYEVKYRDLKYAECIPVSSEAGPWADSITYETLDSRAKAEFVAAGAGTMPLADISMTRSSSLVQHGALGYKYSLQELRVAQHLNRDLDTRRAAAVRRGVEELAQRTALLGSVPHGLPGFLNNAAIPQASAATGTWSGATADQIINDVNDLLESIWTTSAEVEIPDTLLVPPEQFAILARRLVGAEHNRTLLEVLMKQNIYFAETGMDLQIKSLAELRLIGSGTTDRMVAYRKSPDVLTFHFPMPLQFVAPQPVLLDVIVPGEFRLGGTEVRYPIACGFADGI
jgi:hypothetical protein